MNKKNLAKTLVLEINGQRLVQQYDWQRSNKEQTKSYSLFWSSVPAHQIGAILPTYRVTEATLLKLPLASLKHLWDDMNNGVEVSEDTFGELAGQPQVANYKQPAYAA